MQFEHILVNKKKEFLYKSHSNKMLPQITVSQKSAESAADK